MTLEAELLHGVGQQRFVVRGMGTMAVGTAALVDRFMLKLGRCNLLEQLRVLFLMAILAQDILRLEQLHFIIGTVRVMAQAAVFLYRCVHLFEIEKLTFGKSKARMLNPHEKKVTNTFTLRISMKKSILKCL